MKSILFRIFKIALFESRNQYYYLISKRKTNFNFSSWHPNQVSEFSTEEIIIRRNIFNLILVFQSQISINIDTKHLILMSCIHSIDSAMFHLSIYSPAFVLPVFKKLCFNLCSSPIFKKFNYGDCILCISGLTGIEFPIDHYLETFGALNKLPFRYKLNHAETVTKFFSRLNLLNKYWK